MISKKLRDTRKWGTEAMAEYLVRVHGLRTQKALEIARALPDEFKRVLLTGRPVTFTGVATMTLVHVSGGRKKVGGITRTYPPRRKLKVVASDSLEKQGRQVVKRPAGDLDVVAMAQKA